ncbi:MAG: phosphatase PAP2 family protein [bacterium]
MNSHETSAREWYPFDRLVVIYCALMLSLLLTMGRPLGDFVGELVFYGLMMVLAILAVRCLDASRPGWSRSLRLLYPALMFTFFYRATGGTMFLFFDQFFDGQLAAWERSLLGVNPTIFIDQNTLNPILNELFSLAYFCYYLMIPAFLIYIYRRQDWAILKSVMTTFCAVFFCSYLMFMFYPLEGPRWFLAEQYHHDVTSPIARHLAQFVINNAAVRGGCMPSSHFAVALVIAMYVFRFYRKYRWPVLALVVALGIGTVWGRYHYVSDVFVGGLLGSGVTLLVWKLMPIARRDTDPTPSPVIEEAKYVS